MNTADLARWDTPFADVPFPSVTAISSPGDGGVLTLAVAPMGAETYPKYLVRFGGVVAYKVMDESYPTRAFSGLRREQAGLCTYLWADSPWLAEFAEMDELVRLNLGGPLQHYVVLGADDIVEVLAAGVPEVEEVLEKRLLEMGFTV